jgi:uridylate kinase
LKSRIQYKRILIKLSGEALSGNEGYGIDQNAVIEVAGQIKDLRKMGVEIAIVLGGGNIYRGKKGEKTGMDRVTGDYIGMLATVMNALALQNVLENLGLEASVQTALEIEKIAEPYSRKNALACLKKGVVVIFACGTGNPYFTTDTAAALRAIEIKADILFKATKVDGVYDKDPELHKNAKFYSEISYSDVLKKDLQVMDLTAITLCKENQLPLAVFNMRKKGNLKKAVLGEHIGTIVRR